MPREAFLKNDAGRHREKLQSFEMALRDAGIAHFNLVRVSSIFPPRCRLISRESGIRKLRPGGVTYCVISDTATNEPHRLVTASVGIAVPKDTDRYGYLSEHYAFGQTDRSAGDCAEDLAASMLATILGLPFDPEKAGTRSGITGRSAAKSSPPATSRKAPSGSRTAYGHPCSPPR